MPESSDHIDDIIDSLGLGWWSATYMAVVTLAPMAEVNHLVIAEFIAPPEVFHCQTEDGGIFEFDKNCKSYNSTVEVTDCTKLLFENSSSSSTLTSDFNLVCSQGWYREFFQMLFTIGCFFGSIFGGALADRYGRLPIIFLGTSSMALSVLIMAFSSSFSVIFVTRFLLGLSPQLFFSPLVTLGIETCPTNYRAMYSIAESLPFGIALPLAGISAYFVHNWRNLLLFTSITLFVSVILSSPCILDESPRWLVSKGKIKEAERVFRRASRLNNKNDQLPHNLNEILLEAYEETLVETMGRNKSFYQELHSLIAVPEMRTISIVLFALFFCEGFIYMTLTLRAITFSSPFLYISVIGVMEVPSVFVVPALSNKIGRIKLCSYSALITAFLLALTALLGLLGYKKDSIILMTTVAAYITMIGVSQMLILLAEELFPTSVRSLGTGLCLCFARFANNLPPLLDIFMPSDISWLMMAVNSVIALLAAWLASVLPETKGRPLMQTVEDHIAYSNKENYINIPNEKNVILYSKLRDTHESTNALMSDCD